MALYENVFIARQDISSSQVDGLADAFTATLAENGGQVTKREYWGLKNLSYRIKKNRKGHYVLLAIDAPPPALAEMERTMRINEDVIRFMTVRVEAHEEGPSAMMQSRGRGDDRPRRGFGDRGYGDRGYGDRGGDRSGERGSGERAGDREGTPREVPASSGTEGGEA